MDVEEIVNATKNKIKKRKKEKKYQFVDKMCNIKYVIID